MSLPIKSDSNRCAACKYLRRQCIPDVCIFAPHFPAEEPQKFANVNRIFSAWKVQKFLKQVQPDQREDLARSLAFEAEARIKDPVYGSVKAMTLLQREVVRLQLLLDSINGGD